VSIPSHAASWSRLFVSIKSSPDVPLWRTVKLGIFENNPSVKMLHLQPILYAVDLLQVIDTVVNKQVKQVSAFDLTCLVGQDAKAYLTCLK
jgi:hypothetical protein